MEYIKGKRTRLLAGFVMAAMAVFFVRLFYIQIIQHNYYTAQADSEYIKQFTLHAQRGEIYALEGDQPVPLVMNETVYTVWADPTVVTDKQKVVDVINKVAGGNTQPNFAQLLDVKNSRYQVRATKVTRAQAEMIKKENLAGVGFDAVTQRVYPEGQLASQVLGFVNSNGDGQYGFEQYNNSMLKGKDGMLKTVTDIRNVPLTIGNDNIKTPAVNGKNAVLTIDRDIQAKVEQVLAQGAARTHAKQVSAIVVDPNNGHVLAMANMPTYDPNKMSSVTDISVFNNDTISKPYEVGSVAKTLTMGMGINEGVMTPQSTYDNLGYIVVDGIRINNADQTRLLGRITMQDVLDWSLNSGVVTMTEWLGGGSINLKARNTMYEYFHNRYHLGQLTGIQLAGETPGTIIPPTDVQGNSIRYSNMAFGQGMSLTMVQTAAAFSSVINGGTYYKPTILAGFMNNGTYDPLPVKPEDTNVISAQASQQMRAMIHHAHYATWRPNDPAGYYIGGKTGTSQTIDPKTGKYRNTDTIGTYLGFGGNDPNKPAYVIMTTLAGGGNFGGGDAKVMFNQISDWMLGYLKLPPKG